MIRYIEYVLQNRYPILLCLGIITVLSLVIISHGVIGSSVANLFLGESPDYYRYMKWVELFGNDEIVVIAIEQDAIFDPAFIDRLNALAERILDIPDVAYVDSILTLQRISGEAGTIHITPYADAVVFDGRNPAEVLAEVMSEPLAAGLLVSDDGHWATMIIELTYERDRPAEAGPVIINQILDVFRDRNFDPDHLHQAGYLSVLAEIMNQTYFSLSRILPAVALVLLLTVFIMFRRLWPVIVTGLVAFLSVTWTMALAVLINRQINILLAMVPAVVIIVSFSDVIHLCSAYLLELGRGESKAAAIRSSGSDVGIACFFTSITTFVGFVALSLIPTPVFRQLGVILGFGVAVSLLIAITLVPILFSIMRQPKPWQHGGQSRLHDWLESFLHGTIRLTGTHPWGVITIFAAGLVLTFIGLTGLRIETSFSERLAERNRVRLDEKFFERIFHGTTTADLYLGVDAPGDLLEPEILLAVSRLQLMAQQQPEIDTAVSLITLLERVHDELNPNHPLTERLPASRQALAQYLLILEMADDLNLDRFIDFDRRTMRIALRLAGNGMRETYETGEKIAAYARNILPENVSVDISGLPYLLGKWLDQIVIGQRNGLLFAFLSITLMMMIGLRSIRIGLWAMIPNVIPILALGGLLGWLYDSVDSDTIAIAMIAIGIGVDDTIHFFMRLRLESSRCGDTRNALPDAFYFTGRAIVITSIILVAGFSPFCVSQYFSTRIFGTLLPFTLVIALAADLFLVPALVQIGAIRFTVTTPSSDQNEAPETETCHSAHRR